MKFAEIPTFDGLRACAALAVFAVHWHQIGGFTGVAIGPFDLQLLLINGNCGVALFFSLSGFLLSLPYWRAAHERTARPEFKAYWLKRVARIVPAYYMCLAVLVWWQGGLKDSDDYWNVFLHITFLFNYDPAYFYDFNPPFWTLAVEMQFYALLPLLFLVLSPLRSRALLIAILAVAFGAYGLHAWLLAGFDIARDVRADVGGANVVYTHSVLAHLPHFLFGTAAAGYTVLAGSGRRSGQSFSRLAGVLFWLAVAGVVALLATELGAALAMPWARYYWPGLSLCFVVVLVNAPRAKSAIALLHAAPLRYLGQISYGIYLLHYPALRLVEKLMGAVEISPTTHWIVLGVAGLGLSIALASVSFHAFERPVLRWARRRVAVNER